MSLEFMRIEHAPQRPDCMAGAGGLEPPNVVWIRCSAAGQLSKNIIDKGLAFGADRSGTVAALERYGAFETPALPVCLPRWGFGGAARRRATEWRSAWRNP